MVKKKQLTRDQEFEIMKIVLDKFLLLGVAIMAIGIYLIVNSSHDLAMSFAVLSAGLLVIIIFGMLIIREYNFLQH